jgi:hypothetical protein
MQRPAIDQPKSPLRESGLLAWAGVLCGPLFAVALVLFALPWPDYRHADHPPAVLGALGYAGSLAWNVIGYGLVGALALLAAHGLYLALREAKAGSAARIGATLAILAALAFIAQGVFPLDLPRAIDVGSSRRHVAVWNLWWIAAVAAALAIAFGVRALRGWRTLVPVGIVVAGLMACALLGETGTLGNGWRQRIALAAWFAWIAWASELARRAPR